MIRRSLIILAFSLAAAAVVSATAEEVVQGLDHIPLAVKNLEQSKADFQLLGFALKPGRLHENGLNNAHVKFPDGTEIELITAPTAADELTSEYYHWLEGGDGPAFLGLYSPDTSALIQRLSSIGLSLDRKGGLGTLSEQADLKRLFFAGRQHSPTDRPDHFAHANTALSLAGVWLSGAAAEQRLLAKLGAAPLAEPPCGPFDHGSAAFSLPEGVLVFLPATAQLAPGRSIVGATVTVKDLATARRILTTNRIGYVQVAGCDRNSVWVSPATAHGMWLEFYQPRTSR